MFTGIVQARGRVESVGPSAAGVRLVIDPGSWDHAAARGDSICVSGCCLTVAQEPPSARLCFDAIPQTLRMTTLGTLAPGDAVNLERALTAASLLGGHFVQGHVDGVGEVLGVQRDAGEHRVRVRPSEAVLRYLAPKGSVCVDGVSLTIAELDAPGGWFEVALIPTTLEVTTLGSLGEGSRVNLEADMIAKTVVHHLEHFGRR